MPKTNEMFHRTSLVMGQEALDILATKRVAIFGVGGVGGYALEALVRGGLGAIDVFDGDIVQLSNLNRQIIGTQKSIGRFKVDVAKERALEINPDIKIEGYQLFYSAENADEVDLSVYDYIIDAIDTVKSKILLIERAKEAGVPIISSMGAGNKMDPTGFLVDDIYKTSVCPLAKVMRKELKSKGIEDLKVVYSREEPIKLKDRLTGSTSFVPPACGLAIAGEVIKDLVVWKGRKNG